MFEASLVPVFENCFMFSKTRKIRKRFLVSSFFFFVMKNIENTKFSKQEKSSSVLCVFKNYS